jgi:putative flippase GtrA
MIFKFLRWLWSIRRQFIKYFITGVSAVILDVGSLFILKEYAGMRPLFAVVINQVVILNFVFFINKYWSFKANGATARQVSRFLIVAGGNYIVAIVWMWFFNERLGLNYLLARVINIAVAVAWNFLLYRYFVYANTAAVDSPALTPLEKKNIS